MAGRFGTVALAVFVLSVSAVAARRAILSEASGAQVTFQLEIYKCQLPYSKALLGSSSSLNHIQL